MNSAKKVDKKVQALWKKEFKSKSLYHIADALGMDIRTLTKAVEKGECMPRTADIINAYILRERKKLKQLLENK